MKLLTFLLSICLSIMCFEHNVFAQFTETEWLYEDYESYLQQIKYVEVEGGQMAYLDIGEGEPIVLIHGLPTNSWLYRYIVSGLLDFNQYRLIVPDLIGFGASDKPKDLHQYDFDKQGKRILNLMDTLQINQWTQVAHETGLAWTCEMISHAQGRLKSLVILNNYLYYKEKDLKNYFEKQSKMLHGGKFENNSEKAMRTLLKKGMDNYDLDKRDLQGYIHFFRRGTLLALNHFNDNRDYLLERVYRYQAILERQEIPLLVIWGLQDEFCNTSEQMPYLKRNLYLTNEDIVLLKYAKHFIPEEKYGLIVENIHAFMTKNFPPANTPESNKRIFSEIKEE